MTVAVSVVVNLTSGCCFGNTLCVRGVVLVRMLPGLSVLAPIRPGLDPGALSHLRDLRAVTHRLTRGEMEPPAPRARLRAGHRHVQPCRVVTRCLQRYSSVLSWSVGTRSDGGVGNKHACSRGVWAGVTAAGTPQPLPCGPGLSSPPSPGRRPSPWK